MRKTFLFLMATVATIAVVGSPQELRKLTMQLLMKQRCC